MTDDRTIEPTNVIPFPTPSPRPVAKEPENPLIAAMAGLSITERFDFVWTRYYREPADNPEIAGNIASLNVALFGAWGITEVLLPVVSECPNIAHFYTQTIEMGEQMRQRSIEVIEEINSLRKPTE